MWFITSGRGVISFNITQEGRGYTTEPAVTSSQGLYWNNCINCTSVIDIGNTKFHLFRFTNPGSGYTVAPTVTIADPDIITGRGNFLYNDLVVGQTSNTEAVVRSWDADTKVLKVTNVGIGSTVRGFIPGEEIRIQTGIGLTGLKIHKTVFTAGFTTTGRSISAGTTVKCWNANTTKFNVGDDVGELIMLLVQVSLFIQYSTVGNILLRVRTLNTVFITESNNIFRTHHLSLIMYVNMMIVIYMMTTVIMMNLNLRQMRSLILLKLIHLVHTNVRNLFLSRNT